MTQTIYPPNSSAVCRRIPSLYHFTGFLQGLWQSATFLQQNLSLEQQEIAWQMRFNPCKCTVIRTAPNKRKPLLSISYSLLGQTLFITNSSKYLSVTINEHRAWNEPIYSTAGKGNRTVGFLRRNFRNSTPKVKAVTYKTIVRSAVQYASTVWDPQS